MVVGVAPMAALGSREELAVDCSSLPLLLAESERVRERVFSCFFSQRSKIWNALADFWGIYG